jgi:hypothetical protein
MREVENKVKHVQGQFYIPFKDRGKRADEFIEKNTDR